MSERLAIVMPAYNEEGCIDKVCRDWLSLLDRFPGGCLIVVDDGSHDRTGAVLDAAAVRDARLCVVHQKNAGHGAALMTAYRRALADGCDWVFHVDSDAQFLPADFDLLWSRRKKSPVVTGWRLKRHDAPHRLVIMKSLRLLNLAVFGVWIADCNVPYRLIRADYLARLLAELPPDVFALNVFLSVLAAKAGCDLQNVPVSHCERATGAVSIIKWSLVKACWRSARELLRFRLGLNAAVARLKRF